jgi:hypothetical protein
MSGPSSVLRGDYSTKIATLPTGLWRLQVGDVGFLRVLRLPHLLRCEMLVASLPSASPGGWLQVGRLGPAALVTVVLYRDPYPLLCVNSYR